MPWSACESDVGLAPGMIESVSVGIEIVGEASEMSVCDGVWSSAVMTDVSVLMHFAG